MNPKLLLFLSWIFYLAARRTNDEIWLFCLIYCGVLTICAFFYQMENKSGRADQKAAKKL